METVTYRYGFWAWQTHVATLVFVVVWMLIAKKWSFLPIENSTSTLCGALLMVLFQIISVQEALAAIDSTTLLLLLGLMLIFAQLEQQVAMGLLAAVVLSYVGVGANMDWVVCERCRNPYWLSYSNFHNIRYTWWVNNERRSGHLPNSCCP